MTSDSAEVETDENAKIGFRLTPQKKRHWQEYLNEESPQSTLTDLIKTSVDNAIDGKWVLADKHEATGDVPSDLADSLDNISDRLSVIEERLDDRELDRAPDVDISLDEQELRRLAYQAHDVLPIVQDEDHLKSLIRHDSPALEPHIRPSITGTAQDISTHIDAPEHEVRSALIYLEWQDTENIDSVIHDETRRWFEVDESVDRGPPSSLEIEAAAEVEKEDLELTPGTEMDDPGDGQ